ncbi:stage II sporulation protein M [Pseudonocardia sp. TRM90224]|uniref:stage II sporulation protein M n=1 Tax=Pseudonocardia sp. TRM90224 TaxID=2812678 RepID=UPI001E31F7F3|nr:stage II sporulation protein M [Pseudonocardia sp. TRM90224]
MDVDAYAAAHRAEWQRLEALLRKKVRSGQEADELVTLYQRTATHLSAIRSSSPDPALVARLSTLVARARAAVTGSHTPAWRDAARFFVVGFPAALYLSRRWWGTVAVVFLGLAWVIGAWVAANPDVQASIATPEEIRRLVDVEFAEYYTSAPAGSFAAQVWTNNALIAAMCLVSGIVIVPVIWVLWSNLLNLGVTAGIMASADRLDLFFGLITPHGLPELTAVFIAAGAGLRLGWALVDPGPLPRSRAVAEAGRATVGMALGVAVLLLISGIVEAFVTPSSLPTWARIGIGVLVEAALFVYVFTLGRRAARAGESGDVSAAEAGDHLPTAG